MKETKNPQERKTLEDTLPLRIWGVLKNKCRLFFVASQAQIDPHQILAWHEEYLRHQAVSVLFPTTEEEKRRHKEKDYPSKLEAAIWTSVLAERSFSVAPPILPKMRKIVKERFCTIRGHLIRRRQDVTVQDHPSQISLGDSYVSPNATLTSEPRSGESG